MIADLKFTCRSLSKAPAFTAIAIVTLALGIGATIAIFSLVDAVLLRPLSYRQPQQLMRIYTEMPTLKFTRFGASQPEYMDLLREARAWQSIDAWMSVGANFSAREPTRITAALITGGLLQTLGVPPALGRLITSRDDEPGATLTAVISYGLWQRDFASERTVLGRDVLLNGQKYTIVGVMPQGFRFPPGEADVPDVWVPMQIDPAHLSGRGEHFLNVLGRLKPGATLHQAQMELDALVERSGKTADPDRFIPRFHTLVIHPFQEEVVRGVRPALQMLFGAVCFLLLIACVNVANLLLARAEARQREIAIRGALGAGGWRLTWQFLVESVLLSTVGTVLGLILAEGVLRLMKSLAGADIPGMLDVDIDGRILFFALGVTLVTGVASGLAPLTHVLKQNLHDTMKAGAAATTDTAGTQRFRQTLIVAQLALALMLLTGTGLLLRGFWKLQEVNPGFDPKALTTMSIALTDARYSGGAARDFWTRLEDSLKNLPAIEGVALTSNLPPVQQLTHTTLQVEGFVPTLEKPLKSTDFLQVVSHNYFDVMRIRCVQGRLFEERDSAGAPPVAIVNQTLATLIWGNEDPIGRRVHLYKSPDWHTIVGVVADSKNAGVENPTGSALYLPYAQADSFGEIIRNFVLSTVHVVVRSAAGPGPAVNAVRREINRMDPSLPLAAVRTMDEAMSHAQSRPRFLTAVLTAFASIAVTLAAIGIYGVIAYAVVRRTKEIGLRMALGAQGSAVLGLVLRRGVLLIVCGVAIGLAGSLAATRLLSGFLFGVTATDPATFVTVPLLLSAVALLACWFPARRATKIDPLAALRAE